MLKPAQQPDSDYDHRALTSEDLRSLLYDIAAEMHLARMAMRSYEDDFNIDAKENETILAVDRCIIRTKQLLEDIAGGDTFDRLTALEEATKSSRGMEHEKC
jgi:hypothetical protein